MTIKGLSHPTAVSSSLWLSLRWLQKNVHWKPQNCLIPVAAECEHLVVELASTWTVRRRRRQSYRRCRRQCSWIGLEMFEPQLCRYLQGTFPRICERKNKKMKRTTNCKFVSLYVPFTFHRLSAEFSVRITARIQIQWGLEFRTSSEFGWFIVVRFKSQPF